MAEKPLTAGNREILKVKDGLDALANGIVDKTGPGAEITRFEFDDSLSWNIAKNLDIFERGAALYEKERKRLGAKLGVTDRMPLTVETAPKIAEYQAAEDALLDKTQDLTGVLRLSRKALQAGNKIPPGVLKNLIPILSE